MRGRPKGTSGKKTIVECSLKEILELFSGRLPENVRIPVKRVWLEKWRLEALTPEVEEEEKIEMIID